MPLKAPVVFPLHPIINEEGGAKCACGNEDCDRVGKHPAVRWAQLKLGDAVPLPVPGAGAGIKTGAAPLGSGVIVVDLDGPEAAEWFAAKGPWPYTFTVRTPRGWHLYFQHPGFPVRNSAGDLAKGVDVRGDGGFVAAPGSPHRSGATYTVAADVAPVAAPGWLLEWLSTRPAPTPPQAYAGDVTDPKERQRRRELYAKYLAEAPPCIEGQGGDGQLFEVVQHGAYDLALPTEDVLELVAEHFDPRCDPPWGGDLDRVVAHKAHDAKTKSTRPRQEPLPDDPVIERYFGGEARDPSLISAEALSTPPKPGMCEGSIPDDLGERWGGWDQPLDPPPYLLEGIIPAAKVVTFYAQGGSVKTWSALALAIAVATGQPWLGVYPVRKGRALYLDYEDGPYEFQRRVRMLTGGQDVPDLGYLYSGPQIDKVAFWVKLTQHAQAKNISLLACDSLGAAMPGNADENATSFAEGMKLAGRFTETGCTVLFVHHANKAGGIRGTSAIRDQSDVVFQFDQVSETDDVKRMRMICDKPGPQKKPPPVNIELSDKGLYTFKDEAADLGRNAQSKDDVETAILLAVASAELAGRPYKSCHALIEAVPIPGRKQTKLDRIAAMVEAGDLAVTKAGVVADSPDKRRARVLALLRSDIVCRTKADIAKHAAVPALEVDEMRLEGDIVQSAEGRWLAKGL